MKSLLFLMMVLGPRAFAQEFNLGKVEVVSRKTQIGEIDSGQVASSLSSKDIQKQNRQNVGDALNLLSGVTMSTNARNEKIISVRGFDSRQVPLFIDGIPVYVPFDGYVDFARFTTADLARIQVAKGYSSMAYGPNAIGGAINLISKKPQKKLEADLMLGGASGHERRTSANVGTNQGLWYLQTGASYIESDYFPLSKKFRSTPTENGGRRNNSYRKDLKVSAKVGVTPKTGSEYAVSFYQQNGEKGQPPSTVPERVRYWQWPYWNKQSLYFVSQTQLREQEILKTRLYHDGFDNKINAFQDDRYRDLKTSGQGSVDTGKSIFNDQTNGGSIVLESFRFSQHALSLMGHYKSDDHKEFNARNTRNTFFKDELISFGMEDTWDLTTKASLSMGYSHHTLRPLEVFSTDNDYKVPHEQSSNEWQAGSFYQLSKEKKIYATVASKTRMPTLKDRYSHRLGVFIPNPGLKREQSLNLETGFKGKTWDSQFSEFAVFTSAVHDKIQTVLNVQGNRSQVRNVDRVRIYGVELGHQAELSRHWSFGGNYTHTYVKNISDSTTKITDVPRHKGIVEATYSPERKLRLSPFIEYNSRRWASNTKELSGFTIMNFKTDYAFQENCLLSVGVTNLSDKNYFLAEGFPSAGRMFFANFNVEI